MCKAYYAGIGSRETPVKVLTEMRIISRFMSRNGYILRCGGTDGAGRAFLEGCRDSEGECDIWVPWKGFNDIEDYRVEEYGSIYEEVSKYHRNWGKYSDTVKKMHSRNYRIILGADGEPKSDFVVCWTPDGRDSEGTGFGIRVAREHCIPVYNLCYTEDRRRLKERYLLHVRNLVDLNNG